MALGPQLRQKPRPSASVFVYWVPRATFFTHGMGDHDQILHLSSKQRWHFEVHLLTTRETALQFTCPPLGKYFAVQLHATRGNILQFIYLPPGKQFAVHLLAIRQTILQFLPLPLGKHFTVYLLTNRHILQFTYPPLGKPFRSSPNRH